MHNQQYRDSFVIVLTGIFIDPVEADMSSIYEEYFLSFVLDGYGWWENFVDGLKGVVG